MWKQPFCLPSDVRGYILYKLYFIIHDQNIIHYFSFWLLLLITIFKGNEVHELSIQNSTLTKSIINTLSLYNILYTYIIHLFIVYQQIMITIEIFISIYCKKNIIAITFSLLFISIVSHINHKQLRCKNKKLYMFNNFI